MFHKRELTITIPKNLSIEFLEFLDKMLDAGEYNMSELMSDKLEMFIEDLLDENEIVGGSNEKIN